MRVIKVSRYRIQYPYIESIRDYSRLKSGRVSNRVVYADTSKNEATWCKVLGD